MQTIHECALVALAVSIPSAGRKATKADLKKASPNLPPDQIATMGVFRAFEPKLINGVQAKKREAERLLESVGVKFGRMGRLIPPNEVERIEKELERIGEGFKAEKAELLRQHQMTKDAWPMKFPDWAEVLEQKSVSVAHLREHTDFRYHLLKVVPAGNGGHTHEMIAGVSGQLIQEVVKACKEILEESFLGREQVGQKSLNRIREVRRKVSGLAFVSADVAVARDYLDATLEVMPERGVLSVEQTQRMRSVLHTFSDPEKLNREIEYRKTNKGPQLVEEADDEPETSVVNDVTEGSGLSADATADAAVAGRESEDSKPVCVEQKQDHTEERRTRRVPVI